MTEGTPFIEMRLHLEQRPKLVELIGAFAALSNQFDDYIRRTRPNLSGAAQLYVKEIRQGSTIVELVPVLAPLIANMDTVLIVDEFVERYGGMLKAFARGERQPDATRSQLKDFADAVTVIAHETNGKAVISSAIYHETKTTKHVEIQFDTGEARQAQDLIERQRREIDLPAYHTVENVLMVFWQSNLKEPQPGQRTGEKAVIEDVYPKPLAVVYETDLARERIKHEIGEGERNLYKRGFFVDCYVQRLNGKPVAYRISNVREVIDLPGDD